MAALPNLISGFRLILVPGLLLLAWLQLPRVFLAVLVVSLLSDGLDGYLARRLNATSDLGAKLDSWADMATWLMLPLCAWLLRPDVLRAEGVWLVGGIGCYIASILFGFAKYRRLVSYHTWGAKALSWLVGAAVLVFFANGPGWVFRIVMPIVALSAIEEMAMTVMLPTWHANVPTLWHALKRRKVGRKRPTEVDGP
jgi:phosphatidylglycerophosphate synthase